MQATSIAQLMDLETPLEQGVKAAFDAMDLTSYTRLNASADFQKKRPRIEVEARILSGNGHCFVGQTTGAECEDQWACELDFNCLVQPQNQDENNSLLPELCAAVRQFASQLGQLSRIETDQFPFHCFPDRLISVGTEYNVLPGGGVEWRKLTYRSTWGIRSTAFPVDF